MKIDIIGKNSNKKSKLINNLYKSIKQMNLKVHPKIYEYNIDDYKNYHVQSTPALVIEDVLISEGEVLSEQEITKFLKLYIN